MTPEFDKLYNEIIEEAARCKHPTLPTLSDHPNFKFMRCVRNPYSSGIKRVHYWRKDGTFDYDKCKKIQRPGSEAGETCKLYHKIQRKKKLLKLLKKMTRDK